MTQLIAKFDGLKIQIEGIQGVTYHQLFVTSRWLNDLWIGCHKITAAQPTIAIEFDGLRPTVSATADIDSEHFLALAGELLFGAQMIFSNQQQAMAMQAARAQQQMNQVRQALKGDGGLILPS